MFLIYLLTCYIESKNFVNYNNAITKTKKYERPETVPLNAHEFDPYKTLSNINNHKHTRGPNFDLMTSRPQAKNALPCFVQVNFSQLL